MKKLFIIAIAGLLLIGCNSKNEENTAKDDTPKDSGSILAFEEYKNINLDEILKITKIRYTVGGAEDENITDRSEINSIYNMLKELKVGKETDMACEDNTTIYRFEMKNNEKYSIEIECDWFVINGKHYNIVK